MKFLQKIFGAVIAATVLFTSATADAKIVADKLPLLTYAETPVAVYDTPNGKRTGTITAGNSLVLVKIIRPDGWAYGSYKVGNKKKRPYRWFKMSELQGYADFENYTDQAVSDQNTYRTRTSSNLSGLIAGNEDLIVVAKRGDKVKVLFKADGNFYRMGWVDKMYLKQTANTFSNTSDDLLTNSIDELPADDTSFDNGNTFDDVALEP